VSDDEFGRCCDCKLEYKIVIRVRQEWPPSEKHLLVIGQLAKAVHNPAVFISRETWNEPRPQNDRLILTNEGEGSTVGGYCVGDEDWNSWWVRGAVLRIVIPYCRLK
jgi:hypothetical protein